MSTVKMRHPGNSSPPPGRQRALTSEIERSLRSLTTELVLLNQQVGDQVALSLGDFQCIDLIDRISPVSPTALAHRTGIHPATLTGILDRLERGGWVIRERDPVDRRGVVVRALRRRSGEVVRLYAGMLDRIAEICADLDEPELEVVAGFLRRTIDAGRSATEEIAKASRHLPRASPSQPEQNPRESMTAQAAARSNGAPRR
jgi:DNA-binding MarR family transcriptional regulator